MNIHPQDPPLRRSRYTVQSADWVCYFSSKFCLYSKGIDIFIVSIGINERSSDLEPKTDSSNDDKNNVSISILNQQSFFLITVLLYLPDHLLSIQIKKQTKLL